MLSFCEDNVVGQLTTASWNPVNAKAIWCLSLNQKLSPYKHTRYNHNIYVKSLPVPRALRAHTVQSHTQQLASIKILLKFHSRLDLTCALSKADPVAISLAVASENNRVTIFKELPCLSIWQGDWLCPTPSDLQQWPIGLRALKIIEIQW